MAWRRLTFSFTDEPTTPGLPQTRRLEAIYEIEFPAGREKRANEIASAFSHGCFEIGYVQNGQTLPGAYWRRIPWRHLAPIYPSRSKARFSGEKVEGTLVEKVELDIRQSWRNPSEFTEDRRKGQRETPIRYQAKLTATGRQELIRTIPGIFEGLTLLE